MRSKNGRPLRFTILTPNTSLFRQRYAVLLQAQFKTVGALVDVDVADGPTTTARLRSGDWDAVMWTFSTDPGPSGLKQNWGPAGIGPAGQNYLRYSNRLVDAQLDSATASFDVDRMKQHASKAFQAIIDDAPAIFLYDVTLVYGLNRRITVGPMRVDEWWANLADWSIPADKRIDRDRIGLAQPKS
jgi:peptide/nickel transport system substrate-binding protein